MKKKTAVAGIALAAVIVCVIVAVFAMRQEEYQNSIQLNLYFLNEKESTIVAEKREIRYNSEYEIPERVLDALKRGPVDKKNLPIMSRSVDVQRINVENGAMAVDFSQEYLTDDQNQNMLATYAVAKSLCQIDGINTVKVTAEGRDIIAPDGRSIDALADADINLESDVDTSESKDVVLYFADSSGKILVREQRTIRITDKQPLEQYIVNELIKGPESKELSAVLTSDSGLISAETNDGTCFVNFKANFVDKNTGSEDQERLAVYAVVNALTELENVRSVQFLVEGKRVDAFGTMSLSEVFRRNEDIIAK